jgi:hypothetical protein
MVLWPSLIPALVSNAKRTDMVNADFSSAVFTPITEGINLEMDAGFLASLYKCFADSLRTLGGRAALSDSNYSSFVTATQHQLHSLATKRQSRAERINGRDWQEEQEDMLLMEELEGFALDEMQKALELLGPSHSLLVAIRTIRDIHLPQGYQSELHADDA